MQWLIRPVDGGLRGLRAPAFHAAAGEPPTLTLCPRGEGEERRLVETGLALLPVGGHCTKVRHRVWAECQARWAFPRAAVTVLGQWQGFQPTASGFVPLSMADFRL